MACLILQKIYEAPNFLRQLVTTDEAGFTRDGVFDNHNTHVWCDENPHQVRDRLIGPHIIPPRLNGAAYLVHTYLHDGAPPHCTWDVTQWLNNNFGEKWIG
jgi:hypothetical protein